MGTCQSHIVGVSASHSAGTQKRQKTGSGVAGRYECPHMRASYRPQRSLSRDTEAQEPDTGKVDPESKPACRVAWGAERGVGNDQLG